MRSHLLAIVLLTLASWAAVGLGVTAPLDNALLDASFRFNRWRYPPRPPTADPVIVGIDDSFAYATQEPLELRHLYLSDFLDAAVMGEAHSVALAVGLPDKPITMLRRTDRPGDDYHLTLLAALIRTVPQIPIVVGNLWDAPGEHFEPVASEYKDILASLAPDRANLASTLLCVEGDGHVRRYPGPLCQPGGETATLSGELAKLTGNPPPDDGVLDFQRGVAFGYVPLTTVLELRRTRNLPELRHLFAGKVVLLGHVLHGGPRVEMPIPLAAWLPGERAVPEIVAHAQAVRSLTNEGLIATARPLWSLLLAALFALFWLHRSVGVKLLVLGLASTGLVLACAQLLWNSVWLPPGAALLTGLLAWFGRTALDTARTFAQQRRLTQAFQGYVSPAVMSRIVADGPAALADKRHHVCVMFTDIRGFTTLSERLPPEETIALLNRYFALMTEAVHRHEGTLDKFIGDGLMAFFGAPAELEAPEANAFAAAWDMFAALEAFNRELAAEGKPALTIGVGLHCGDAVVGDMGSPARHAYTAVGDTVNTASRLEGLCKETGYNLICSEAVVQALGPLAQRAGELTPVGVRAIKGHTPIMVYGGNPMDASERARYLDKPHTPASPEAVAAADRAG